MYKLLIVDDEDHLRNLIIKQVDWEPLGFEVASARNGRDALAVAQSFRPDALLTDIRMPFIDGLELIRLLQAEYPGMLAIVLSGHDEFSYAKESLRMGVTNYLLKPIKPSMLTSALQELKNKLDEQTADKWEREKIQMQLTESLPFLRQQYLLLTLNEPLPEDTIRKQFDYLGIELSGTAYTLCLLSHDELDNPADKFFTFYAVQNILLNYFKEGFACFFDNSGMHYILCALQDDNDTRTHIKTMLQSALADISAQLSLTATVAIGTESTSLSSIKQAYTSALAALDNQVIYGRGKVYDSLDFYIAESKSFDYSFQSAADMIARLPFIQPEALTHNLEAYLDSLRSQNCTDITFLHIVFADLINNTHKLLSEYDQQAIFLSSDIYHQLFSMQTFDDLQKLAAAYIANVKKRIDKERKKRQQSIIVQAHDYLSQNYCDCTISLSQVAQRLYVSPSYLSNLFKRKYDINFVEFITNKRMEKAKELLTSTALKTYEIAAQVGYNDPQYFSNSFKKYAGCSPSEYKLKVLNGS